MTEAVGRRGRPRSPKADAAIVAAVLELITEHGLGSLTIESVAARAGVGKTTLYRRWPNKDALVLDALAHLNDALPDAAGDTLRERLISLLAPMRDRQRPAMPSRLMPRIISHRQANPELYRCFFERVIVPRRARFLAELRAGVTSGEIRDDIDLELAVNVLVGPVIYQALAIPDSHAAAAASPDAVVDLVLSGLAPRNAGSVAPEPRTERSRTPLASR